MVVPFGSFQNNLSPRAANRYCGGYGEGRADPDSMVPAEFSCGGGMCQSLLKTLSWDVLSGRIAARTNAEEQTYLRYVEE